jgi:nucleotide-binding universal stress UspA family protein
MDRETENSPVVVGIDGSDTAVNAAVWALDEAIRRDTSLRLVHAVNNVSLPGAVAGDPQLEIEYAESALSAALDAVHATGKAVKTETAIVRGTPDAVLIAESRGAALLCVGSAGVGWVASKALGSTAAALAVGAHCPVALIRDGDVPAPHHAQNWIAVGIDGTRQNTYVITQAMEEARLRHGAVLAVGVWQEDFGATPYDQLDRCVEEWRQRYPDVNICPVATRADLMRFLADNHDEHVQLAVIGEDEAHRAVDIIGPHGHSLVAHGECSVLIARQRT